MTWLPFFVGGQDSSCPGVRWKVWGRLLLFLGVRVSREVEWVGVVSRSDQGVDCMRPPVAWLGRLGNRPHSALGERPWPLH